MIVPALKGRYKLIQFNTRYKHLVGDISYYIDGPNFPEFMITASASDNWNICAARVQTYRGSKRYINWFGTFITYQNWKLRSR